MDPVDEIPLTITQLFIIHEQDKIHLCHLLNKYYANSICILNNGVIGNLTFDWLSDEVIRYFSQYSTENTITLKIETKTQTPITYAITPYNSQIRQQLQMADQQLTPTEKNIVTTCAPIILDNIKRANLPQMCFALPIPNIQLNMIPTILLYLIDHIPQYQPKIALINKIWYFTLPNFPQYLVHMTTNQIKDEPMLAINILNGFFQVPYRNHQNTRLHQLIGDMQLSYVQWYNRLQTTNYASWNEPIL